MIINHNMPALNTYRQLSTNTANTSKSLEKLSSGLRINKAGDDAAGLAISEKMRGQIRGLDQAGRNAQDGISLINTAEGSLSETHSILQRMRELAVQAGNDTNVSVDRNEIQKEINQLTSEINRIGNTTEYNTQKLLNGGSGSTSNIRYAVVTTGDPATGSATGVVSAINHATSSVKAGTTEISSLSTVANSKLASSGGTIGSPLTELQASVQAGTIDINKSTAITGAAAATAFTGAVTSITDKGAAATATFTVDFASALTGKVAGDRTSVSIGAREYTFDIGASDTASVANLETAIKADITANAASYTGITTAGVVATGSTIAFTSSAVNTDIKIGTYTTLAPITAASVQSAILTGGTAGKYTFEVKAQPTVGDQITVGGQTFTAVAKGAAAGANQFNLGDTTADTVTNLVAKFSGTAAIGNNYNVTSGSPVWASDSNSITFTKKAAGVDGTALAYTTNLTVAPATAAKGQYKFEIASNFTAGQKVTIGGQDFVARASGVSDGTGFVIGADINATADNLITAINANTTLNAKFDAVNLKTGGSGVAGTGFNTDADTIVLQEKTASGKTMANALGTVTVTNQAAVKGAYSFELSKNVSYGDSITIGSNTYKAGTSAEVSAGTAQFVAGATIADTTTALKTAIEASGLYDVTRGNSTFGTNDKLTLTEKTASGTDLSTLSRIKATAVAGVDEFLVTTNFAAGDRLAIGGQGLVAGTDFAIGADVNATATNISNAINANSTLKDLYTSTVSNNKVVLTEKTASGANLTQPAVSRNAVAGQFQFNVEALSKGTTFKIDGTSLTLAAGGNETETAKELKGLVENNSTLNAKYTVSVSGPSVTLTQKAGQESATSPTLSFTTTAGSGYRNTVQIGANTGQSMNLTINDMRAKALGTSSATGASGQTVEVDGKQFAVAWTSSASVSNGTDNVSVEYALDVSNHDNATAAVEVINSAIQTVSAERSKLGAYTNRLEHTVTNLGTSSENLTAAESRVRDADMAKEMMYFQKNNILSQAAQAMLAQANQQGQGVLQLLR